MRAKNATHYKALYDSLAKRIGWNFSHVKSVEKGQDWDFYEEALKKSKPTDILLDIGTGGGERILKIAKHFKSIYGIDHSPSMVATALKNYKKTKFKNVSFVQMKSNKLDFLDNYFDIITDRHCDFSPKEVYRVLKKGGYFLTQQVSEGDQINTKKAFKRGQSFGIKDGTLKNKYLKELKSAGFVNIKSFDYNSEVIYQTPKDYLFILRFTPTIPEFGKRIKDFEIFKDFVEKNTTDKGVKTNSKRFMIIAKK